MLAFTELVTRRWRAALVLVVCLTMISSSVAFADHRAPFDGTEHDYGEMVQYDLVFPVAGDYTLRDTFYASRTSGDHHAQDIMADKMVPIVAAASGTIRYINWTRDAEAMWTNGRCCTMVITHDDGWETWYIHMNNDTPGTDDGQGWGIADGLVPGSRVEAGQHIGWVGDSGNAESTPPHLHFELYDPEGVLVNPYEALLAAADPTCEGEDCYPFTTLSYGSRGASVAELQTMLLEIGHDPGPIDGIFGTLTRTAVQAFESANGLTIDGVVDEPTWDAIVAAYEARLSMVERRFGIDRFATAGAIAAASHPNGSEVVFVAVGTNFPDAIAAGPAAAHLDAPILLVRQDSVPTSTADALQDLAPTTVYVLGGPAAVADSVLTDLSALVPAASVSRLAGGDRYATSVAISSAVFTNADTVYVATGTGFADAITAAPAAVVAGGPLLLVSPTGVPGVVATELARLGPARIVIVGGEAAVPAGVATALEGYASTVERLAGNDRYHGSAVVSADTFPSGASTVYIAVGTVFADALAGGASVGTALGPVLLVDSTSIPAAVEAEIRRLDPTRIVIFGGPVAVADAVATALGEIPGSSPPSDPGGGDYTYDPSAGVEQWRPLVEDVFAMWGLDQEKCGADDRSGDCIGPQVDNAMIIMDCESSGVPDVVNSSSGTTGLFQHRPIYWESRTARVRNHFPDFSPDATPYDPYDNVMVAALLVHESRDALLGYNSLTGPWDDGPEPWGHWDGSSRYCADPPLVSP
jgi:putative cell wall-binding protein/murein DD-endopeptidase MepM/ murein hydrolase activator NlpD